MLHHSRQMIELQRQVDLIEMRMKYVKSKMERDLNEALVLTNNCKRSSVRMRKLKEGPQRRNTFAYFKKSPS